MNILIGFVNKFYAPNLNLGVINIEKKTFNWIFNEEIEERIQNVKGVNGIIKFKEHFIVGYQSKPTKIVVFNKDFRIISVNEVPEIVNLHTFSAFDDKLYCVSTGTDEIFCLTFDSNFNIKTLDLIYKKSKRKTDNWHINSICNINNKLIITCFGLKNNKSWKNAKNGQVINISDNTILKNNLFQPHTSYLSNSNKLMYCESGTNTVFIGEKEKISLEGYTRGITEDNENYYIGLSGRRLQSRSKGTLNTGETTNKNESNSGITIVDKNKLEIKENIVLSQYGIEIFDLVVLDSIPDWIDNKSPFDFQLEEYEKQIYKLVTKLHQYTKKEGLFNRIKNKILSQFH